MRQKSTVLCLVILFALGACSRKEQKQEAPAPSASVRPLASVAPPPGRNWALQSGPVLAILAGQGVGPIRLGATIATIERHMALPCDVKTGKTCRYIGRAVEFRLPNGVTESIHVHRAGRSAGKVGGVDQEFGFFNGAIPPDLRFGMTPAAIIEHLGPAERIEKVDPAPPNNTAERHFYPGLVVEYDRHANGNLILGGVVIEKKAAPAPAASASAATSR